MRLLLVHGMGRTPLSLASLARFLRRDGHQIEGVGYIAALESFSRIRRRVRHRLEALARRGEPYAVIGHSLGGVALRSALGNLAPAPRASSCWPHPTSHPGWLGGCSGSGPIVC